MKNINKGLRHQLKMLHYKKRLNKNRITDDTSGNYYAFRSHGTPCSCYACQQLEDNYNRAKIKIQAKKELQLQLDS